MSELDWRGFNNSNNQTSNQPHTTISSQNSLNNSSAKTRTTQFDPCTDPKCCMDPCDLYSIAGAIALLLYNELNLCQLKTMVNLFALIEYNLAAIVTQILINKGTPVNPPF